ncbi:disease resistance protein [Tanacetum coccineum]
MPMIMIMMFGSVIWGMGGIGKTTLAHMHTTPMKVKTHFELKCWVYVSVVFDVKRIIKQIIKAICGPDVKLDDEMSLDDLQKQLQSTCRHIVRNAMAMPPSVKTDGSLNVRQKTPCDMRGSPCKQNIHGPDLDKAPAQHSASQMEAFNDSIANVTEPRVQRPVFPQLAADLNVLNNEFTRDEIQKGVCDCAGPKAQGPDAVKKFWDLLKNAFFVCAYIKHFESSGRLAKGCNPSLISLQLFGTQRKFPVSANGTMTDSLYLTTQDKV